jgi:hypothetical protein
MEFCLEAESMIRTQGNTVYVARQSLLNGDQLETFRVGTVLFM